MVDISWSEIKIKAEGLVGGGRVEGGVTGGEEEDAKETMTDGHWRRGEEEGIRVGVGGHWHCFKAPAQSEW